MKPYYTSILAILATVTIVGMLTMGTQQIYAPRNCGGCSEFKKLTNEFEKNVIDIGSQSPPDPDRIQALLDQYNDDVMALFRTPSTSP
jgi:arsenate reductase-like glutaredoxin family protein